MWRRRNSRDGNSRGFSLIELMIVVAIIGILTSILVPALLDAVHRAKQRRTMAELGQVGTAWMSWLTDQVGASSAGSAKTYSLSGFAPVTYPELFGYLHPSSTFFYMQEVPQIDPWGSELSYSKNADLSSDHLLLICAAARNQIFDICNGGQATLPIGPFTSTDFDQDIVWADGGLIRWPGY